MQRFGYLDAAAVVNLTRRSGGVIRMEKNHEFL